MATRMACALGTILLAALLTGCGPTDAEVTEARAVAEAKASPVPTRAELRPCPGGEIYRIEPSGTRTIKADCFDQAVAEAIAEFPEPLPPGIDWDGIPTPDFADPRQNPTLELPSIEDGVQDTAVAGYWLCAWMDTYVQALDSNNEQDQTVSMAHLSKYTQLPASQAYLVNPEVFDETVIAPAQAGDPAKLREYFKSCSNSSM